MHKHAVTHSHTSLHVPTKLLQSLTLSHTDSLIPHIYTHTHSPSLTHLHTQPHSQSHIVKYSHILMQTHTITHTITHFCSFCLYVPFALRGPSSYNPHVLSGLLDFQELSKKNLVLFKKKKINTLCIAVTCDLQGLLKCMAQGRRL